MGYILCLLLNFILSLCVQVCVCIYMCVCVLFMHAEHTCFYKCVKVRRNFVEGSSPSPFTWVPEIEVRKILLPVLSFQYLCVSGKCIKESVKEINI